MCLRFNLWSGKKHPFSVPHHTGSGAMCCVNSHWSCPCSFPSSPLCVTSTTSSSPSSVRSSQKRSHSCLKTFSKASCSPWSWEWPRILTWTLCVCVCVSIIGFIIVQVQLRHLILLQSSYGWVWAMVLVCTTACLGNSQFLRTVSVSPDYHKILKKTFLQR